MTVIHLLRHGETDWNREKRLQGQSDSQLTDAGKAQAADAALALRHLPFTCAYASSNLRAVDTAKCILDYHAIPLHVRDDLREIYLGHWERRLYADIEAADPVQFHHFWHDPSRFSLEGAENFAALQHRAVTAVTGIAQRHAGETLLLVSHGAFLKALLCHIERRPLNRLWEPPGLHNCSHSIITWDAGTNTFHITRYAGLCEW